jgi:molybdenum cofactor synthesis domain-containing protein
MDGFAVLAEDHSPWREILGDQMAGRVQDLEVTPGTAVRITTGAPLPKGADAVVQVELTEPAEDHVIIHDENVSPGQNVRPVGVDLRKGDLLLPAGTVLGPPEIGLVAGFGQIPVTVHRRIRVSVLSTGDELVEPGQPLGPGQIRDSNRFSLIAALRGEGADVVWSGKAPDEREPLRALLEERIAASDVVVTSGGVSMGELDLVKALMGELTGVRVHVRRVFMKPGKPFTFATAERFDPTEGTPPVLIFGLPGNPVSALAGFEVFIRPALATLSGKRSIDRPKVPVRLTEETRPSDRIEYQRAIVRVGQDGRLEAATTGSQASSRLVSFVGANALLEISPRSEPYASGEIVTALLTGPLRGPYE